MSARHSQVVQMTVLFLKKGFLFTAGGIVIHTMAMFLDHYLVQSTSSPTPADHFLQMVFSVAMFPMIAIYTMLLFMAYTFWQKQRRALIAAARQEAQKEKIADAFKLLQTITGILAEQIAARNAEILNWIESRRQQGQTPSIKIEQPAREIAKVLQSLSELAFVFPYTAKTPNTIEDVLNVLQEGLKSINTATAIRSTTFQPGFENDGIRNEKVENNN